MLNTFSSKLVGLRLRCHSVHTLPTLSLNPFSCFYIVRECVYPASLPLMRGPGPSGAGRTETEGKKAVMFHKSDSRSAKPRHCYNCLLFRQILHISHNTHLTQQALHDAVSLRFSFSEHVENCHTSSIDPKIGHTSVVQKISTSQISLVFITVGRFICFSLADTENLYTPSQRVKAVCRGVTFISLGPAQKLKNTF